MRDELLVTPADAEFRAPGDERAAVPVSPCRPVALSPGPPPNSPLGYAEVPSQFGLHFERRPDGLTIGVPRPWWAGALSRKWILAILAVNVLGNVVFAVVGSAANKTIWILPAVMMLILIVVGLITGSRRLPRREPSHAVRFEVSGGGETLHVRWGDGETEQDITCTRDEIVSIRGDLPRMGLTIRIRRRAIVELLHNRPKVLRVWIAATLREAMRIHDGTAEPE
jgi:hypothetical protein